MGLTAPQPRAPDHEIEAFASGVSELDTWLKKRARLNERTGASRTFVLCDGRVVVGYYSLATASILHAVATGNVRRNMPEPIPAVLIGRLALDKTYRGKGYGVGLLRDAVLRIAGASWSLLLTGDIEAADEESIVARQGRSLASDIVVPPHHGSRGASTAAFVAAVNARLAIFSAGYRNRFGHPVAEVVDRYRAGGAQVHRTDREGAISLEVGSDGITTSSERERRRRYWLAD